MIFSFINRKQNNIMNRNSKILVNKIMTPDGTILISTHVHDYKTYTDVVSGEQYMVDGGNEYLRRNVNTIPYKELSVYTNDEHILIRNEFMWGTRGKNGDQPLKYVKLKKLTQDHIEAIIETQYQLPEYIIKVFCDELKFRKVKVKIWIKKHDDNENIMYELSRIHDLKWFATIEKFNKKWYFNVGVRGSDPFRSDKGWKNLAIVKQRALEAIKYSKLNGY